MSAVPQFVSVQSDTKTLLGGLQSTFTNSTTVLGELLQNARRAGATRVDIVLGEGSVSVSDDGVGIDDFSVLLAIARSGWNEEVMTNESPYGLGLVSSFYACKRLTVASRGMGFSADTDKLLDLQPFEVRQMPSTLTTTVTLEGVCDALASVGLSDCLRQMVAGFPIPVFLNGEELPRPHALDDAFIPTASGFTTKSVLKCGHIRTVYLQGLPISKSVTSAASTYRGYYDSDLVIHLDPALYKGRMPDRDVLIDATTQSRNISRDVDAAAVAYLTELASSMGHKAFIEQHGARAAKLGMSALLNTIDFVPAEWLLEVSNFPRCETRHESCYRDGTPRAIKRSDIEAKGVYEIAESQSEGENLNAWMYVHQAAGFALDIPADHLPKGHWLTGLIQPLSADDIQVVKGEALGDDVLEVHHNDIHLGIVSSLTLQRLGADGDQVGPAYPTFAVYDVEAEALTVTPQLQPRQAVNLVSDFTDGDDQYDDVAFDRAENACWAMVQAVTEKDPSKLLQNFLSEGLPFPVPHTLRGLGFRVEFDSDGKFVVLAN